jgi:tetratricopeptide (TPR) repeat protein
MTYAPLLVVLLLAPGEKPLLQRLDDKVKELRSVGGEKELNEALGVLDVMEQEARKRKEDVWVWAAYWKRADCQTLLGYPARARQTLKAGLKETPEGHLLEFYLSRELGRNYLEAGELPEAEECLERAGVLSGQKLAFGQTRVEVNENQKTEIRLLQINCRVQQATRTAQEALRKELEGLEEKIEQRRGIQEKGSPNEVELTKLLMMCKNDLASLDLQASDTEKVIERWEGCLAILKDSQDRSLVVQQFNCHRNLARLYRQVTRFKDAAEQLDRAEELYRVRKLGNARSRAKLARDRAALLFVQVQHDWEDPGALAQLKEIEQTVLQAWKDFRQAGGEVDVDSADTVWFLAEVYLLRGQVRESQGKPEEALEEYEQARGHCDNRIRLLKALRPDTHPLVLEARRERARVRFHLARLDAGRRERELKDAREEARDVCSRYVAARGEDSVENGAFLQVLVEIETACRDFEEAAANAEKHRQLAARRWLTSLTTQTAAEQVRFSRWWDEPGLHAALRLGIRCPRLGDQSVQWLLNGKAQNAEVPAQVVLALRDRDGEDFEQWQRSVRRQAYLLYGPETDAGSLERELYREDTRRRRLARGIRVPAARPYQLDQVRERLRDDEVYIDVFRLPPEVNARPAYFAWVVTKTAPVQVVRLGDAATIDGLVKAFVQHQEQFPEVLRLDPGPREAEKQLRKECLGPLSERVLAPDGLWPLVKDRRRWIVSPDGPLWHVPWAALLVPYSDTYAVEKFVIRYAISGRDLVRRPAGIRPGQPLVLADPDVAYRPTKAWRPQSRMKFPRLESEEEGKQVAAALGKLLPGMAVETLRDRTTTAELLKRKSPRVLYLSTHGFFVPGKVETEPLLFCGIALAGANYLPPGEEKAADFLPGLMTGAEVLAADLRGTELVVLSACQTGTGTVHHGHNPADLRHAFHLAGARAVVSSLWSVETEHTGRLMVAFLDALADKDRGMDHKADALRAAQVQMIGTLKGDPTARHSHPFFWAAFTLSGD